MRCLVTAGPTFEPLDQVRRLTNLSTGRLGSELVNYLKARGHEVILLIGQQATWRGERHSNRVETFTTTADLAQRLRAYSGQPLDALFHAAAVSDFGFGTIWQRSAAGALTEINSGKLSTREGTLLAELVPTPKIIAELRGWFPKSQLIGWKYEVDGDRESTIRLARQQLRECRTDACAANGPGYGEGFGIVTQEAVEHVADTAKLFERLEQFVLRRIEAHDPP